MSCSIASIFTVCRAMMRCICAFSASSSFSLDKSLALMPAYFDRQRRIVFAWTPLRREFFHRSSGVVLGEDLDDLRFGELTLSHEWISRMPSSARIHRYSWLRFQSRSQGL